MGCIYNRKYSSMMLSISCTSASLHFWAKGALSLFENKTPTTDQPEQHCHKENSQCSFITSFFLPFCLFPCLMCGDVYVPYTKHCCSDSHPLMRDRHSRECPASWITGIWRNVRAGSQGLQELGLKGHFCNSFPFCFTLSHFTNLNPCVQTTLPNSEMQQLPLLIFSQLNVITPSGIRPGYSPTLQ